MSLQVLLGHNKPCPNCLVNPFTFTHWLTRTATGSFSIWRSLWNQCNALQLCAVCSNAFV